MGDFEEQMRLFEAEVMGGGPATMGQQGHHNHHGGPPKPSFMPSSVRSRPANPPPPPAFQRPPNLPPPGVVRPGITSLSKPYVPPQKSYSAAPQISSKPKDEGADVLSTLMKYEKEVRTEKRIIKDQEKIKKKQKKLDSQVSSGPIYQAQPSQQAFKPSHVSADFIKAPKPKPGTSVTADEIKLKAKQMVEQVKASQITMTVQTKKVLPPPPASTSQPPKEEKPQKKPKKFVRVAGGQIWEDPSLLHWDNNDFRIFCGDLGNDVTDEVLTRTFGRYPSFVQAKVVRDKRSNKTKGYGFISFRDPTDFTKAMREMDGKYVGSRPIKLRKSNWKDRNIDIVKQKQKLKQSMGYKW